jgi:hypothetical protein
MVGYGAGYNRFACTLHHCKILKIKPLNVYVKYLSSPHPQFRIPVLEINQTGYKNVNSHELYIKATLQRILSKQATDMVTSQHVQPSLVPILL